MTNLIALQKRNDAWWQSAKITGRINFNKTAKLAYANRSRYIEVVHRLRALGSNMPDEAWVFIAVIHERESSMDFNTHLGQGDPLTNKQGKPIKTVHVPANRGPFVGVDAFEQAAVDALWYCAPYAAKVNRDWSISGMLTFLERYNGLAYANAGRPSPYVWSGTSVYDPPGGPGGKVLVDHGPITNTVDVQPGVAGLLKAIDILDDTIFFGGLPQVISPPIAIDLSSQDGLYDAVWLQETLNRLGATPALKVDGINGNATKTVVRAFQKSHGLKVDGLAGTQTITAIKAELVKIGQPVFPKFVIGGAIVG
jgi:lysozyme family protein